MFNLKFMALGVAGALLLGLSSGGWMGYRLASGGYEKRLHAQAVEYAEGWRRAVETADRNAQIERARAVAAANARNRVASQTQEIMNDGTADPDLRPDSEWRASQRLRLQGIYRAHSADPGPAPD